MLTAVWRTALFYLFLIFALRFLGKRQIGELEPGELVLTMLISELASTPMQSTEARLLDSLIPIVTILALSLSLSYGAMKSLFLRRLLCGQPSTVIENGVLQQQAMRHCRLTLDELFEELRAQGVSDLATVKYAVLETNGQLSVLLYPADAPATPRQLGKEPKDDVSPATILISGGTVHRDNLKRLGLSNEWLAKELARHGCRSHREAFLLSIDRAGKIAFIPREK